MNIFLTTNYYKIRIILTTLSLLNLLTNRHNVNIINYNVLIKTITQRFYLI